MDLVKYLTDLENRINPDDEERLAKSWEEFADLKFDGNHFFAPYRKPVPSTIEWEPVYINDAIEDDELMIYQQLHAASGFLGRGSGELLCIRSNYGTGIIPSMFDAEVFTMPRETDTLPCIKPFPDGKAAIQRIISKNQLNYNKGFANKVFSMAERYLEAVEQFPKVKKYVHYYNPDLQGPLALCEALWGSEFYIDFYDDGKLIENALDFFCDVYIDFTHKWHKLCPTYDSTHSVEWGCLHRGGTVIRNDAAMNISGELYQQFVMPRDQRIISTFGGGIHFCGRGDHYVKHISNINGLTCINLSEPNRNDMEIIYQNTVDKGIIIFGLASEEVEHAVTSGRDLCGRVHSGASIAAWLENKD